MASWPLGCCSFQNILTNPIISQTDTLLPPYIISYYSSAFTIISTTTTPKCTLHVLTCHCTTACSTVYSKSVLLEWTYLQLIVTRARQSLDYSARMKELVPCCDLAFKYLLKNRSKLCSKDQSSQQTTFSTYTRLAHKSSFWARTTPDQKTMRTTLRKSIHTLNLGLPVCWIIERHFG